MRLSLRRRLALWLGLAMVVVIFALVFTAYRIMVESLRTSLDHGLRNYAVLVSGEITDSEAAGQDITASVRSFVEQESVAAPRLTRLADPDGTVLANFGAVTGPMLLKLDDLLRSASVGGNTKTVRYGKAELRVYTLLVTDPRDGSPVGMLQVADSLAEVTRAENRLLVYTLTESLCGSLITVLVGLVILRRGLRPLDRILDRVSSVKSSDLAVGLPEENRPPELQQLADSLNDMWRRLAEAIRRREAFVASASHDLRTPLSVLQGQIEVLAAQPSLDTSVKDSLKRMQKEVRRLIRLANNILLNAQLDSNPVFARRDVHLRELLEETAGEVAPLAQGLDFALFASDDVVVSGDRDLLKQMVLNVVDNAIKYTPKGGQVELSLIREDEWAVLEVSDSGVGIAQADLPHIMEPFYKAKASAASPEASLGGGAGLGLAIAKQIAGLHGGQIEIRSQQGSGTMVKLRLPSAPKAD